MGDSVPVVLRADLLRVRYIGRLTSDDLLLSTIDDELTTAILCRCRSCTIIPQAKVRPREHLTPNACIDEEAEVKASVRERIRQPYE